MASSQKQIRGGRRSQNGGEENQKIPRTAKRLKLKKNHLCMYVCMCMHVFLYICVSMYMYVRVYVGMSACMKY